MLVRAGEEDQHTGTRQLQQGAETTSPELCRTSVQPDCSTVQRETGNRSGRPDDEECGGCGTRPDDPKALPEPRR